MVESRVIQCGDEIDAWFSNQERPQKPVELEVKPASRETLLGEIAEQREFVRRLNTLVNDMEARNFDIFERYRNARERVEHLEERLGTVKMLNKFLIGCVLVLLTIMVLKAYEIL